MPSFTNFLNLTLPSLSEFVDSWNEPMNQNFETIDDWTEDLYKSLVSIGGSSTWAALRGSLDSLAARLDISILPSGEINISGSQDILDMSTSAYKGGFLNPRDRLNDGDRETYDAGQPFANGRFIPTAPSGPTAGQAFPHGELDSGIAVRSADFGAGVEPISSPPKPWTPGLVFGGAGVFISAPGGTAQVQLNAASTPAIFNIDGYVFRIREDIKFDFSGLANLSGGDYVWLYVDRDGDNYGEAEFKYSEPIGVPVARDLRVMKSGGDGTTANSTFTVGAGAFDTLPFRVKEGDILNITGGGAEGEYVIQALVGGDLNNSLTIKGQFKDDLGPTVPYEIIDRSMPHIGAARAVSAQGDPTSRPPFVAGRVYFGRVKHIASNPPLPVVTFARGGVYDSGWLSANGFFATGTVNHELGAIPSRVEIWVRENSTLPAYKPLVLRQVVTNVAPVPPVGGADIKTVSLLFPSMWHYADELIVKIDMLNESIDPAIGPSMFTKDFLTSPVDVDAANGEIRVIAWR